MPPSIIARLHCAAFPNYLIAALINPCLKAAAKIFWNQKSKTFYQPYAVPLLCRQPSFGAFSATWTVHGNITIEKNRKQNKKKIGKSKLQRDKTLKLLRVTISSLEICILRKSTVKPLEGSFFFLVLIQKRCFRRRSHRGCSGRCAILRSAAALACAVSQKDYYLAGESSATVISAALGLVTRIGM